MKQYGKIKAIVAAVLCGCFIYSGSAIAADGPIELSGDVIEYDARTDMAKATGGVKVTRDGGVLTGGEATYNFKTQEVTITGGVTAVKDDMNLKADKLYSSSNQEYVADGNVVAVKGENTLTGPQIRYNQATSDISMLSGGSASGPQAEIKGDVLSGNLNTQQYHAVGNVYLNSKTNDVQSTSNEATYSGNGQDFTFTATGNVNIQSPSRNIVTNSDNAVYNSAENGKLVLTGNAVATQNNNIVRGNTLTVYMGDNINIK